MSLDCWSCARRVLGPLLQFRHQRLARLRTNDAIDLDREAGLERSHGMLRGGAVFAVDLTRIMTQMRQSFLDAVHAFQVDVAKFLGIMLELRHFVLPIGEASGGGARKASPDQESVLSKESRAVSTASMSFSA